METPTPLTPEQQIEEFNAKFSGRKLLMLKSDHPHAGETGEVVKMELLGGRAALRIKGEFNEFYCFNPLYYQFID